MDKGQEFCNATELSRKIRKKQPKYEVKGNSSGEKSGQEVTGTSSGEEESGQEVTGTSLGE